MDSLGITNIMAKTGTFYVVLVICLKNKKKSVHFERIKIIK